MIDKLVYVLRWITGWAMYLSVIYMFSFMIAPLDFWRGILLVFVFSFWAAFNIRRPGYKLVLE